MRLRYRVDIDTYGCDASTSQHRARTVRGLTLTQAWRVVIRAARRGQRLHGGEVVRGNWGARGGAFPSRYRHAVIRMDAPQR